MSDRQRDQALIVDMLEDARDAIAFARSVIRKALTRRSPRSAVLERWIEITGEAGRGVSETFREAHPEVAWVQIVQTRHILAHDYGRVNHDIIWRIVATHLPELIRQFEPLVPSPPPDPEL